MEASPTIEPPHIVIPGRDPWLNQSRGCQMRPGLRRDDRGKREGIGMTTLIAGLRNFISALALIALALTASPVAAQQPTSVDPPKSAVSEEQLSQQITA